MLLSQIPEQRRRPSCLRPSGETTDAHLPQTPLPIITLYPATVIYSGAIELFIFPPVGVSREVPALIMDKRFIWTFSCWPSLSHFDEEIFFFTNMGPAGDIPFPRISKTSHEIKFSSAEALLIQTSLCHGLGFSLCHVLFCSL